MIVAGIMSGTSADGVDVAVCRISSAADGRPKIKLIGFTEYPYKPEVRRAVLAAMNAEAMSVANMSRLHWRLGSIYADAVEATAKKLGVKLALIGCHGQTIYHQGTPAKFLGEPVRATWQLGEPSVIAERLRVPVVSDFRPADLAAGGQAAPLVPKLDVTLFSHKTRSRILLNLGGIANLTAIPAGAGADAVMAFDTGPANMVIDACMERLFHKRFDSDGATGQRGRVLSEVVAALAKDPYFAATPPKSCGREEFGEAYVGRFLAVCEVSAGSKLKKQDIIATATALTADSIADAYRRFVWAHLGQRAPLARGIDLCIAGGGARNAFLMRLLRERFEPLGVTVRDMEELGVPAQAKEGVAFALLAWLTWNRLAGNVPAATGASRCVVLGKVTYGA
nr:anhydro-N-acetylmuramic acid kinase [Granulicella sibirica]